MLLYISIISLLISSLQIFGILAIGGEDVNTAMLILIISIIQGINGFSAYSVQNATLKYYAFTSEKIIEKFVSRKIFINVSFISLVLFSLQLLIRLNPPEFEMLNNILFYENNHKFLYSLLNASSGIGFMMANTYLYTLYRYNNKLAEYELKQVIGNLISTLGVFYFLYIQDVENASFFLILRYLLPCLLSKKFYKLNFDKKNNDDNLFSKELKKLIFGAAIFKLMMPIDRFIIGLVNPTSIIGFSVAQQINSAYDVLIGKVIIAKNLNLYSQSLARKIKPRNSDGEFLVARKIFILGFLYYSASVVFIYFMGLYVKNENYGLNNIAFFLILLLGQPIFSSASSYLNGLFYSNGKSEISVLNGVLTTLFGFLIKIPLIFKFGVYGIPIGISIQYAVAFLVLNILIKRGKLVNE
ncbi:MAG: hypothetical protein NWS46_10135 [Cyclobacteriaceae bacterium]|nr:hypothetical protein [Cyclobacteriaceae bacterium]